MPRTAGTLSPRKKRHVALATSEEEPENKGHQLRKGPGGSVNLTGGLVDMLVLDLLAPNACVVWGEI